MILAPPDRPQFHLPVRRGGGAEIARQFTYVDLAVTGQARHAGRRGAAPAGRRGSPSPQRDRHYGLRIRGLGSGRGGPAKLDADRARVVLWGGDGGAARTFAFQAGVPFALPGEAAPQPSLLVPKVDPAEAGGRRVLELPVGLMALRCSAGAVQAPGAASPMSFDTTAADGNRRGAGAGQLRFDAARLRLVAPPAGTSGGDGDAVGPARPRRAYAAVYYAEWTLRPTGDAVAFNAGDDGVFPVDGDQWLDPFATEPRSFALLEHPGASLSLDPAPPATSRGGWGGSPGGCGATPATSCRRTPRSGPSRLTASSSSSTPACSPCWGTS